MRSVDAVVRLECDLSLPCVNPLLKNVLKQIFHYSKPVVSCVCTNRSLADSRRLVAATWTLNPPWSGISPSRNPEIPRPWCLCPCVCRRVIFHHRLVTWFISTNRGVENRRHRQNFRESIGKKREKKKKKKRGQLSRACFCGLTDENVCSMHEAQKSKSFETFRFLCVCFHSSFLNLINVVHKTGENEKIRVVSGTDCTRQKRLVARPFFLFFFVNRVQYCLYYVIQSREAGCQMHLFLSSFFARTMLL